MKLFKLAMKKICAHRMFGNRCYRIFIQFSVLQEISFLSAFIDMKGGNSLVLL